MNNEDYPLSKHRHLAERIEKRDLNHKSRNWNGRDDNHWHHHGIISLNEDPLYLKLSWRRRIADKSVYIGTYKLNLYNLLQEGYVRREGNSDHKLRLRFYHGTDGLISIQKNFDNISLTIGKF